MGVTVMIIMGLLSVLAISSIDFDGLDEIRTRIEEAQTEQEESEEALDTSELGWLEVDNDTPDLNVFDRSLLSFLGNEADGATSELSAAAPESEGESDGEIDAFESFEEKDTNDPFADFTETERGPLDATNDLWPLEAQSKPQEEDTDLEEEDRDMIELAGFNAAEDAIELPYTNKQDEDGNDIPPEVTVSHNNGWTDVRVNEETHSFAHSAESDFKGLEPEDILLRAA